MSLPTPSAQVTVRRNPDKDILQFRDPKGHVCGWFAYDGTWHYPSDGSGYLPTVNACMIIATGPYIGTPPSNLLMLSNQGGIIGWISGTGVTGGTLASLTTSPIAPAPVNGVSGFIDTTGTPQGILG
jgi:hypothetical protein